jgi:predicted transcriptional regulator
VIAFFGKALAWVLKNPVLTACIVLGFVVAGLLTERRVAAWSWDKQKRAYVAEVSAATLALDSMTLQRDAAQKAAAGNLRTVEVQRAELARRDAEDIEEQRRDEVERAKVQAAQRDLERALAATLNRLAEASRRKPSCAALLDVDLRKECGL